MSPVVMTGMQEVTALFSSAKLIMDEKSKQVQTELPAVMEEVVAQGELEMKQIITDGPDSITPTGEKRAAGQRSSKRDAGLGIAGRVESDVMRQSVTSDVQAEANSVTGKFGWIDHFEDYFAIQEDGYGAIKAMHALLTSFTNARERLRARLNTIVKDSTK